MAALSSPQCLFNSRAALQRVFSLATSPAQARHLAATGHVLHSQVRTYAAGPPPRRGPRGHRSVDSVADGPGANDDRGFSPLFTTAADIERSQKDRMPQDFEIKDPKIMVLENGSIAGPLSTRYVMSKLDEKTESLRMIRPYIPKGSPLRKGNKAAEDGAGPTPTSQRGAGAEPGAAAGPVTQQEQFALCEIVNKFEAFLKEQERKQKKKASAKPKTKEMELTWSISEHDLQTKLRQLGGFLAKGMKVHLVLGRKKGGQKVDDETMRALLKRIQREIQTLDAREVKPREGEVGRTMRLHLEGVVKKQT
ncbi:hypothetical protein LMH87_010855 [Akanthomyces muscarius]|uniref:Translation initiation factor 3 C-terminal domain-containing protein n=1 Tax=Akanthomyces muscarius TaxID=2231603 RepID=A0A9W8Q824_AKAMU|nr:hypothetical protein LMH87_010855 [Akanthomyces muscarius]KAJ4150089.1 hypothetical protein LMH87_010855 [Akanthomyces muscarius]